MFTQVETIVPMHDPAMRDHDGIRRVLKSYHQILELLGHGIGKLVNGF